MTDYENAALTVFVAMLANIVNTFDLDFVIPMSLVSENMSRAHTKDAASLAKFFFKLPKEEFKSITRLSDLEQSKFMKSNVDSNFGKPSEELYQS